MILMCFAARLSKKKTAFHGRQNNQYPLIIPRQGFMRRGNIRFKGTTQASLELVTV